VYNPDALMIADYAAKSPVNTFRVGLFVLSTINQHFEFVPRMMTNYERYGIQSRQFMGWQKVAIRTLALQQDALFAAAQGWRKRRRSAAHYAVRDLIEYPGFGIVKASFFAQLLLPHSGVGCLDRHNLRLYGLSERAFSTVPTSIVGVTRKINTYLALCRELGGSEPLWDRWCGHLAALRPQVFDNVESVSKLHVQCIIGDRA